MKAHLVLCLFVITLALTACSGPGPTELLETARLEEKQHNPEHAATLYREIISRFPESEAAKTAAARLAAIAPTP